MLAPVLFALIAPASAPVLPVLAAAQEPQQAVRVWTNRQGAMDRGDKVRVYTRAAGDGYLLVLHVEPNGRVRVLFPLDPLDDNFVRGGQDYEIRGRGDREAFRVYDLSGAGTIFAALSPDPYRFEPVVLNAHWDYRAEAWRMSGDPEADLVALVDQLTAGARYDYDIQRYVVGSYVAYGGDWYQPSFYDPYYHGHSWYGGSGFSIRVGLGYGWWPRYGYNPWYWDPWWDFWWYPATCWGGCFYGYWPYYYYNSYYPVYAYPYRAPARYVYVTSGGTTVRGGYTFKSPTDRWGLAPDPIGVRRRTTTASAGSAASPSRVGAEPSGRRTASAPSGSTAPDTRATPGRRTADQPSSATAPGTRATPGRRTVDQPSAPPATRTPAPQAAPGRRSSPPSAASPPSSPPPRSQPPSSSGTPTRRQLTQGEVEPEATPPLGEPLPDGSWRLPTPPRRSVGDARESAPTPLDGPDRRGSIDQAATPLGPDREPKIAAPRGLKVTDAAPPARREPITPSSSAGPVGSSGSADWTFPMRVSEPRAAEDEESDGSSSRQPVASPGGRRVITGSPSGSMPSTRSTPTTPNRPSASPTRGSTPTRSATPARRPTTTSRSSPPKSSSAPARRKK